MEFYIVLGIIVFVVIIAPKIIRRICLEYSNAEKRREIVSKPFVCPNCGHRFYTKQKNILFQPMSENKAILKCPNCGKRDVCGRPYDIDEL